MPPTNVMGKVPAQIGDLRATANDGQAKLEWSAPFNNGFPIIGYKITQSNTGSNSFTTIQKSDVTPNAIITGLTNDASYNFKVSAINSEGIGKESVSVSVIPKSATNSILKIPQWVKNNAEWWAQGLISDSEYAQAIEYLINQGIIKIK
jgi:hypothetical protein